jgi:hypothetical protein
MRLAASMAVGLLAALLSGCATADSPVDHYRGVQPMPIEYGGDTWRIFDKPPEDRLMVTPSVAKTAGMALANGLTLGTLAEDLTKPEYQSAVEAWLARTGRTCRVTDGYVIARLRWEFRYACNH